MSKFTAQIDLSNYFEDERKQVLLLVDPAAMATVADLVCRVEKMFELENVGFLCKNTGCYILPQETVEIVQLVKVLQAFSRTRSADDDVVSKPKKSKKLKHKHVEAELVLPERQEVYAFVTPVSSMPQKKRKYIDESHPLQQSHKSNEKICCNTSGLSAGAASVNATQKSKKPKTRATAEDLKAAAAAAAAAVAAPASVSAIEEEEGKAKRKRTRSHAKQRNTQDHSAMENLSMDKSAILQNSSQHFGVNKSHIHFNATDETVTVSTTKTPSATTANKKTSFLATSTTPCNETNSFVVMSNNKTSSFANSTKNMTVTQPQNSKTNVSVQESPADIAPKIIFRCKLSEISFKEARMFPIKPTKRSSSSANNNKSAIIIQEHIVIKPAATAAVLVAAKYKEKSYSTASVEDLAHEATQLQDATTQAEIENNENSYSSIEEDNQEASSRLQDSSVVASVEQQQHAPEAAVAASMSTLVELEEADEEEISVLDDSEVCLIDTTEADASAQMDQTAGRDLDTSAENEITIEKIMPFSLPMLKLPDVGDIVIFKMYRLGKSCTPGISNFIAGKCEYTNKRTKMIKLFIIDGHSELSSLPSKFSSILDDSQSENNYLNVKISELLEARVFQMS